MKPVNRLLISAAALLLISAGGARPEAEGVVTSLKGEAHAYFNPAKKRTLRQKSYVYAGESVETADNSTAEIKLADGSLIKIPESARVQINDSSLNSGGFSSLTVFLGNIWASVSNDEGPAGLEVETVTTVVGVRGTEFWVGVSPDGTTRVIVDKGEVKSSGGKKDVTVGKGQGYDFAPGSNPEKTGAGSGRFAWSKFEKDGLDNLRNDPEGVMARAGNAMEEMLKNAGDSKMRLARVLADYRDTKKEVQARTRILLAEKDKKELLKKMAAVLGAARKAQKEADRSRAAYELIVFAAEDAVRNPKSFRGGTGAVDRAEQRARKLDPPGFQAGLFTDLIEIGRELEDDISRFDLFQDMNRVPRKKKQDRMKQASGGPIKPGTPQGGVPPGPDGTPGDLPPIIEPETPTPEPEPEPEPHPHFQQDQTPQ